MLSSNDPDAFGKRRWSLTNSVPAALVRL